ncbi:MAG: hypothetical protein NZ898_00265 [Myxococcota bacterium]|nr:hypothetical protein [Myxococcota bacterium]MDW8361978.1 hypothetical protein [Myxococcales bacterium]
MKIGPGRPARLAELVVGPVAPSPSGPENAPPEALRVAGPLGGGVLGARPRAWAPSVSLPPPVALDGLARACEQIVGIGPRLLAQRMAPPPEVAGWADVQEMAKTVSELVALRQEVEARWRARPAS